MSDVLPTAATVMSVQPKGEIDAPFSQRVAWQIEVPWADAASKSVRMSDVRRVVDEGARTYPTLTIEDVVHTIKLHGGVVLDQ